MFPRVFSREQRGIQRRGRRDAATTGSPANDSANTPLTRTRRSRTKRGVVATRRQLRPRLERYPVDASLSRLRRAEGEGLFFFTPCDAGDKTLNEAARAGKNRRFTARGGGAYRGSGSANLIPV